jgi:hypothetical protein
VDVIGIGQLFQKIGTISRRIYLDIYRRAVPPYRTVMIAEALPKDLSRRILYVVQEDGYREQAAMICPGGCGRVLHMNLLPDERPCWRLTEHSDGTAASLHPSVWRKKECRSHFWLRRGRIEWCA